METLDAENTPHVIVGGPVVGHSGLATLRFILSIFKPLMTSSLMLAKVAALTLPALPEGVEALVGAEGRTPWGWLDFVGLVFLGLLLPILGDLGFGTTDLCDFCVRLGVHLETGLVLGGGLDELTEGVKLT